MVNNPTNKSKIGNYILNVTVSVFTLIFSLFIIGCDSKENWQKEQGMIWNTVWHATYHGQPEWISAAIDSLESVGASLSVFDQQSRISYINTHARGPVDHHLKVVYETSRKIHDLSGHLFDPTLSPLIKAWGFGDKHTPTVDTLAISRLLDIVGIEKTRIENDTLYKDMPEISFNFSAIAKGYGVDRAVKALEEKGCTDLMIEIGGEVACRGMNPEGKKWRIMIETPDQDYLNEVFKTEDKPTFADNLIVELADEGLATSGNYRNFHSDNGTIFGHTISPLTGRPIRTDILSASVIAPTCMEADALATACMVMGSEAAMRMLDNIQMAGAFILTSGEVILNDAMQRHLANK